MRLESGLLQFGRRGWHEYRIATGASGHLVVTIDPSGTNGTAEWHRNTAAERRAHYQTVSLDEKNWGEIPIMLKTFSNRLAFDVSRSCRRGALFSTRTRWVPPPACSAAGPSALSIRAGMQATVDKLDTETEQRLSHAGAELTQKSGQLMLFDAVSGKRLKEWTVPDLGAYQLVAITPNGKVTYHSDGEYRFTKGVAVTYPNEATYRHQSIGPPLFFASE